MLLPRKGFRKWAVIACDQFTSDRGYWERVAREVGDAPSAFHMILPEVYLGENDEERIENIHESMRYALEEGWMHKAARGLVLVERTTKAGVRRGLLACIDLEEYSYEEGASSLIRATEDLQSLIFQGVSMTPPERSGFVNFDAERLVDSGSCFLDGLEFSCFQHLSGNISNSGSLSGTCMNFLACCFCSQFI